MSPCLGSFPNVWNFVNYEFQISNFGFSSKPFVLKKKLKNGFIQIAIGTQKLLDKPTKCLNEICLLSLSFIDRLSVGMNFIY
jgi:transcription-repair coupling factor (superfamily II helicase)